MHNIKTINNTNEINLNNQWKPATKFHSKDGIVDENGHRTEAGYKGRQYRIIEKRERTFSKLERFGRGLLGTVAVVCTLCFALLSKSVRNLLTKSKETIRFAVLEPTVDLSSTRVGNQIITTSTTSTTSPEPPKANAEKTVQKQKILPFIEKDANKIKNSIQAFKDEAVRAVSKPIQEKPPLDFTLTPEQQNSLSKANNNKYDTTPQLGVKIIRGGCNFVFFLENIPGFVFKPMEDEKAGKSYIDIVEKASKVISDNRLNLLHVPPSKLIEISGTYFVMQEKADLLSGNYNEVKGIYSICWDNKELNPYIKTIFSQLLEFISKTGFSDVKYDNIPLTMNGRVALIDLDENSVISGLTKGGAGKNDGLLNYIPYESLDEFISIAKEKLDTNDYHILTQKIGYIQNRKKEKIKKIKDYSQFSQTNGISFASQSINPHLLQIFDDKKQQDFAAAIVTELNKNLSTSKNFSTKIGRTIILDINNSDHLFKIAQEIWKDQLPYFSFEPNTMSFKKILPEVLEGLKKSGYIYKYKLNPYHPYVKVGC